MLTEPTHKSKLPKGAKIITAEKPVKGSLFQPDSDWKGYRIIVFDVDEETGAMSVMEILEGDSISDIMEVLRAYRDYKESDFWVPVEHTEPAGPYYLQPDCISLSEALEAAVGIPAFRSDPVPPNPTEVALAAALKLIEDIKGALNTEENGEALVEVARNAWSAEMERAEVYQD